MFKSFATHLCCHPCFIQKTSERVYGHISLAAELDEGMDIEYVDIVSDSYKP